MGGADVDQRGAVVAQQQEALPGARRPQQVGIAIAIDVADCPDPVADAGVDRVDGQSRKPATAEVGDDLHLLQRSGAEDEVVVAVEIQVGRDQDPFVRTKVEQHIGAELLRR